MTHELRDGTILDTSGDLPRLDDEVMTAKELADFLGIGDMSLAYARIPNIRIGKSRLYLRTTVMAWLKSREGKS